MGMSKPDQHDESELRDQAVTDAAEDLELKDEAAQGIGGGDVAKPVAHPDWRAIPRRATTPRVGISVAPSAAQGRAWTPTEEESGAGSRRRVRLEIAAADEIGQAGQRRLELGRPKARFGGRVAERPAAVEPAHERGDARRADPPGKLQSVRPPSAVPARRHRHANARRDEPRAAAPASFAAARALHRGRRARRFRLNIRSTWLPPPEPAETSSSAATQLSPRRRRTTMAPVVISAICRSR